MGDFAVTNSGMDVVMLSEASGGDGALKFANVVG